MTVPAGARVPPPHSHTDNEEFVYVLEGVLRYRVDDNIRELKPGEWMSTPRGSVHHFSNPGTTAARALVTMTPDIGEQYFHDVGEIVNAGGAPDVVKLQEVIPAPAGPHMRGSFEVLFTREAFADYVPWLMFARPEGLDILIHPLTQSQVLDHTSRALWLGTPRPLDRAVLEAADVSTGRSGRQPM